MKKILYVSSHPHLNLMAPSGPGTHMREIIQGLRNAGCEVHCMIAGGLELHENGETLNFQIRNWKRWIPKFIWSSLKEIKLVLHNRNWKKQLKRTIDAIQPDVIYERTYTLCTAAAEIADERSIPLYSEINAPYPEEKAMMDGKGLFHFLSERSEEIAVTKSKKIFVVSSALKQYLMSKWNIAEEKVVVTPNAVRSDFGEINPEETELLRNAYKLTNDDLIVGFVGSIFPYHGVDRLISTFIQLKRQTAINSLKLLIVGDGETLPYLKKMASDSEFSRDIIFTGNVVHRQVGAYIALMDITVMAKSNWYGSPVKIFEYGILKKTVIAPDTIPVQDVMCSGEDGILIADDDNALFMALSKIIKDEGLMSSMALNWHDKVLQKHTWNHVAQQIYSNLK